MEAAYLYSKPRGEFGRDVRACLREAPPRLLAHLPALPPEEAEALRARAYVPRGPCCHAEVDNAPRMSEHEVNTPRVVLKASSMRHTEGGWPKDVDPGEQADVTRFRKKVEKDDEFKAAVKALGPLLARGLRQNNTVDIYEEYFAGANYWASIGGGGGDGGGGGFGGDEGSAGGGGGGGVVAAAGSSSGSSSAAAATSSSSSLGGRPAPSSPPRPGGGRPASSTAASSSSSSSSSSIMTASLATDPPSAKGLAVFRDPCPVPRAATMLNWHPEGHGKLAVAYSLLNFQDPRFLASSSSSSTTTSSSGRYASNPTSSFIWDVHSPNRPDLELLPPSPLCALRYNSKATDTLVGGCYNGLVCLFDLRKPGALVATTTTSSSSSSSTPIVATYPHHYHTAQIPSVLPLDASLPERSHADPVYDVHWVSSKTGNQCVSASTDGQLLWWDTRRLGEPTDALSLLAAMPPSTPPSPPSTSTTTRSAASAATTTATAAPPLLLGASALEYSVEAGPTKYLVGTEQGVVLGVNLRNRKQHNGVASYDGGAGHRHHGPVYALHRNPFHHKFFLTVGDWQAKLWAEDLKTPILGTRYHPAYLTKGCWSPTRPGVFFLARADGAVDVWDLFNRGAAEAAYTHKVGDAALTALAVQQSAAGGGAGEEGWGMGVGGGGGGRLLAVGDVEGTVALLELCGGLAECQPGEKQAVGLMLEREARQERNLELRERELRRARAAAAEAAEGAVAGVGRTGVVGVGVGIGGGRKDEKMEELLRKVDQDFLAMIKEAEGDDGGEGARGAGGEGEGVSVFLRGGVGDD